MTGTLKQHSAKYALAYAMAMMYAAAASLQSLSEVAVAMHWVYVGAAAKVLQPGVVAVIAYVSNGPTAGSSTTVSEAKTTTTTTTPTT